MASWQAWRLEGS